MGVVEWIGVVLMLVCAILVAKKFIKPKTGSCSCGCSEGSKKKVYKAKVK